MATTIYSPGTAVSRPGKYRDTFGRVIAPPSGRPIAPAGITWVRWDDDGHVSWVETARLRVEPTISSLRWEEDRYFSGSGAQRLCAADVPHTPYTLESCTSAEGETTTVVYRRAAMRRAAAYSARHGGGVRGLCSGFLRDGEALPVPNDARIDQVAEIGRALPAAWAGSGDPAGRGNR